LSSPRDRRCPTRPEVPRREGLTPRWLCHDDLPRDRGLRKGNRHGNRQQNPLERRHHLWPGPYPRGPAHRQHRAGHRFRLAGQAQHGPGRLQAHQQEDGPGDRQGQHRQGLRVRRRQVRRDLPRRDRSRLSPHHADDRDPALHRCPGAALPVSGTALLRCADQQGPEGLRAAARGASEDGQDRPGQGGHRHQAASGRAGALRQGDGVEPAAMGRRSQKPGRPRPASCGGQGRQGERGRDEDGRATGRQHVRQVGPGRLQGRVQERRHEDRPEEGQGRRYRDRHPARGRSAGRQLERDRPDRTAPAQPQGRQVSPNQQCGSQEARSAKAPAKSAGTARKTASKKASAKTRKAA